jgi:hypothetical protein
MTLGIVILNNYDDSDGDVKIETKLHVHKTVRTMTAMMATKH